MYEVIANMRYVANPLVFVVLLIVSNAFTGVSNADDPGFAVKGQGQFICSEFVQARETKGMAYAGYVGWLSGYISAINRERNETIDVAPWQSIDLLSALLEKHCNRLPDQRFFAAVHGLVEALFPDRARTPVTAVRIQASDRTYVLYDEIIRRIQKELQERDLYDGPIDASYNDRTKAAMLAFQKSADLKPTGFPDQNSLFRLLLSEKYR
jgi:hypothetical protein